MKQQMPVRLECLCGSFRQATRALTQLYATALRPVGLQGTQFTLLQALSLTGEVTQRRLGEILGMDSTTLTRTLEIMDREGWIAERRGEDRRERWIRLSDAGRAKYKQALPVWEKVQSRLRRQLGEQTFKNVLEAAHQVTSSLAAQSH